MLKTRITKNDRLLMKGLYAIGIEPIKIDRSLQVRDGTTIKEVESKPESKAKSTKLSKNQNNDNFKPKSDSELEKITKTKTTKSSKK